MPATKPKAADLGQLLDYLRHTACAFPGDAEHDHDACHEVEVARVAQALLALIRKPSIAKVFDLNDALSVEGNREHLDDWTAA